ncbi:hypothetical protein [Roseateles depolymerans]|uniref:Uncharacterized protein n=1 Tax=Roseateles depolymerans TaxID=76731 RepID=A0A0U3D2X8_9BURK|nr:hypothetical protein [Roseateles depolymerans]ALV07942.1 hypothetical protein RD2015_3485 [Roseateles depolymerans]REG21839.1 hypothetical protein DES44_0967 [Roseateles depolymerans]
MPLIIQLICEDQCFDFECLSETDLAGRLVLDKARRDWLRAQSEREDEADAPWYLDENGERLPAEELFLRSPWAIVRGAAGNIKVLSRFQNVETGEACFDLPDQYGGEWMREWMRDFALAG